MDKDIDLTTASIADALLLVVREVPLEIRLAGLTPEQRLSGLTPEQRLAGLTEEEALLALPIGALRRLPEGFLHTLAARTQQAIEERLARE